MSAPIPLQQEFLGMRQDEPRDQLPNSALWNLVDFVPIKLGAPLQKRGGWTYGSPALGSTSYVQGLVRTPGYGAGAFNLAVTSNGHVYKFTNGTSSDIGTAFAVAQNPVVHRSGSTKWMVVIPAADASTAPKSYDGTTFQTLAGTPPGAAYAAVWEDRTLLANGTVSSVGYPGRLWFGPVGDAAGTWDTTNSWWDFDRPITGLAITRNGILIYHAGVTKRLRGTVPPTATALSNLVEDDPFPGTNVGCLDARSIVNYNDEVIWADTTGVYLSDGSTIKNLTTAGGMSSYWRGLLLNYVSGWTLAGGVFKDTYIVAVLDDSHAFVDCLCFDLLHGFWYRLSHFPGLCFTRVTDISDKIYMGLGSAGRVVDLENVFDAQNASDADGTAVTPTLETGFFRGWERLHRKWIPSMSIQQWLRLFVNYDLVDGGATPTLTVSYTRDATDPNNTAYTALSPVLAASTNTARARRDLSFRSRGIAFKIAQTGASTDTMIRTLEADYYPLEGSRLEQ